MKNLMLKACGKNVLEMKLVIIKLIILTEQRFMVKISSV